MSITQEAKKQLIGDYRLHENDTGSSYVQVAILTKRIENITKHLKVFKKDTHCKYGLSKLVVRRRKLLNYIKSYEVSEYHNLIKKLGIRK